MAHLHPSGICKGFRQEWFAGEEVDFPVSFAFEGFKKGVNTFPLLIRHVANVNLFHAYQIAKYMPDILLYFKKKKIQNLPIYLKIKNL